MTTIGKLVLSMSVVSMVACGTDGTELKVRPRPVQVSLASDTLLEFGEVSLNLPASLTQTYAAALDTIESRLKTFGRGEGRVSVRVHLDTVPSTADPAVAKALSHPEGYVLDLRPEGVEITAGEPLGALRALTTFTQAVSAHSARLPTGRVVDWPRHRTRAMHFVARDVEVASARRMISLARKHHFNTLIVQLADGVALPSLAPVARPDAWSTTEFKNVVRYARENGLRFVPELKLLSHQGKLLKGSFPNLMYNSRTYDPSNESTYDVVLTIVEDVLRAVEPKALHIGHDEVAGVGTDARVEKHLEDGERVLPAGLFLQDVRRIHEFLSQRGVETWMWGDMLVGPPEFPGMLARHLHGVPEYTALRGRLPSDIVICDWHYADRQSDFPTSQAFMDAGHDVLGATWRHEGTTRRYSHYLADLRKPAARGMIATTWWLLQRGKWDTIEAIAEFSGEAFWHPAGSDGAEVPLVTERARSDGASVEEGI